LSDINLNVKKSAKDNNDSDTLERKHKNKKGSALFIWLLIIITMIIIFGISYGYIKLATWKKRNI
jgi:hypothetical protein